MLKITEPNIVDFYVFTLNMIAKLIRSIDLGKNQLCKCYHSNIIQLQKIITSIIIQLNLFHKR